MAGADNPNAANTSTSSKIATIVVGILAGALLGLAISYFLQPGMLRAFLSFGDYLATIVKVASHQQEINESFSNMYWTAIACTFFGAAGGYFAGRKAAGKFITAPGPPQKG